MTYEHRTVLLNEAVDALQVRPDGIYVDGTFGRGGHSREILRRLGAAGRLLAIDRDPEAVAAGERLAHEDGRFVIVHGDFSALSVQVDARGWRGRVNGLLLDLGVSSPQLDDPARGFSFLRDGPLDMRMNPQAGESAAEFLARASAEEMETVFRELGEERFSRRIAQAIVRARATHPLTTTGQLSGIVAAAIPSREAGKNPATRVFQALRIHVNRELEQLADTLAQAIDLLAPGGRLVVISFHSLEDRIVKRFMQFHERGPELPRGLPLPAGAHASRLRTVGKAVKAGDEEIAANPRARSAVLRVAEIPAGVLHG
ncbi:MAG: 16S rRNA (cytosine(1402)-N(4))-methyltransferase RsmH [Pseudomonadota bacterium]